MPNQVFHGVLKGQTLVILDRADPLPDGTQVEVTSVTFQPGTPAALLAAMAFEPHVTEEDVDELDRAIAAGHRPPSAIDPFADQPFESGTP